ncbi:unnamed protein product [Symbiodinium necroappetens]|uniref:Uncharacterized protein n=1 Tax=Symbiodinium necroappetens TaxID=1628268 RepID=A0A812V7T9_9DINO|nr:unnamed protein product [Symbiodinium necroappetens]
MVQALRCKHVTLGSIHGRNQLCWQTFGGTQLRRHWMMQRPMQVTRVRARGVPS